MKGEYPLVVRTNKVQFKFTVRRNLVIIRGDSATGKTTLLDSLSAYEDLGAASGVVVNCDVPCRVIAGRKWRGDLAAIEDSIVFVDDTERFVRTHEFQHAARHSSNYYVIVARDALPQLPYSVDEIYGLKNTGRGKTKYPIYSRIYTSAYKIYGDERFDGTKPDCVVVEDSGSGYDFYGVLCQRSGVPCVSAHGKSNIFETVLGIDAQRVLVIADGAAFGPEMEEVCSLRRFKRVELFLPESFEWLVLKSGLFNDRETQDMLMHPADHIESEKFFSWEQFFTEELRRKAQGSYLAYDKKRLNEAYLTGKNFESVATELPLLGLN